MDIFDKQKTACLAGVDLSRKGSIDAPIQQLIEYINMETHYFTTSSCSGRIIVVDNEDNGGIRKKGCKWLLTSHDTVTAEQLITSLDHIECNAVFKFEPFVMHVQCRNLTNAQLLLGVGVASGFRNSGISVGNKGKYITAIRSTHSLEVPLSSEGKMLISTEYLKFLVDIANKKMVENVSRIERFFGNLKMSLESVNVEKSVKTDKRKKHEHLNCETKTDKTATSDPTCNIHKATGPDVNLIDDIGDCNMFDVDCRT